LAIGNDLSRRRTLVARAAFLILVLSCGSAVERPFASGQEKRGGSRRPWYQGPTRKAYNLFDYLLEAEGYHHF
jgi:hypothetical protein